ncbi:MAG TPA: NADH-quinone oxidoreductase subunit H [Polyangiaceae bacterium]|jgi:NADH-quinone oxidoreductase subunit H
MIRRALVPVALALAFACALEGVRVELHRADTPASTVRVLDVVPRDLELGERVAILGAGFPAGKPARVTLRGTLHRPGERAISGAEVVATAVAVSGNRLEWVYDEALEARLCGAGDRAAHTTFEGEVEVAFAAPSPGAAPVAGVLERVTVDARTRAGRAADDGEGARLIAWMGAAATMTPSGLRIDAVGESSRAAAAGLTAGDVVVAFDGVEVAALSDLVPAPAEKTATIAFRRSGDVASNAGPPAAPLPALEATASLPLTGFRRGAPVDLAAAMGILGAALLVVWLFAVPSPKGVDALLHRAASRVRRRLGRGASSGQVAPDLGEAWRAMTRIARRESLPSSTPAVVAEIAAYAPLGALPFGQYVVAARVDVGLLFAVAATALASAAFVAHRSVWGGLWAAFRVAARHVPAAIAVASVIAATGSLRIQEIERAQGGWPWQWFAFRSPAGLLALGLLLGCLWIEPCASRARPHDLHALLEDVAAGRPRTGSAWLEAACRGHHALIAGLAVLLFLGGWLLPGVAAARQDASVALQVVGAVWLLAKTRVVWMLALAARWALRGMPLGQSARALSLWLAAASAAVVAGTAAWSWWAPTPPEQLLVSAAIVAGVAATAVAFAHRVRHSASTPGAEVHLSPFL